MKILIFFSRIALICNICFVFVLLLRYSADLSMNGIYSTVVVLGYASVGINMLLNLGILLCLLLKRPVWNSIPRWLIIINFLFLLVQLFIFLP
jgi:hypothetical protein